MPDTPAIIALGDPRLSQLGSPGADIDHKAVGMDFYERRWPFDRLGTIRYAQGPHSFELIDVSAVSGSFDRSRPEDGIYAWSIGAFPMAADTIAHGAARDVLFQWFARLHKAGWRRFIDASEPRLAGQQTIRHFIEKAGNYCTDPAYVPTLDEWMQLNQDLPFWQFWAGGTHLLVRVVDEPSLRNPARPGVYLFDISIQSENAYYQTYFTKVADMLRWKELIVPELKYLHRLRAAEEAAVRRRGYIVDTSYQDPPILALQNAR